jgi:hypothetical protein
MANAFTLIDTPKVKIEVETMGSTLVVRAKGVLDEDMNFSVILKHLRELGEAIKTIHFDIGNVSRINSCGVREWLLLMEQVTPKVTLAFENVNELFIDQANVIPRMLGNKGSSILSFQAPYHCPKCTEDFLITLKPTDVWTPAGLGTPPPKTCQNCGTAMQFDWIPEEYFGFLNRR